MGRTAFDVKRGTVFHFDPDDLVIIGVDTEDGPEHELWDERTSLPIDESMVRSIMSIGVQESITVRKAPDGGAEVVNGRRRVLHARLANARLSDAGEPLVRVPAMMTRGDESHMIHVLVATNEIRRNDDVLVKAAKCTRMLNRNGGDVAEAAIAFGVSKTTIASWQKLAEMPAPVRKAVSKGVLSASAAAKLHGMERAEQTAELERVQAASESSGGKRVTASRVNGSRVAAKGF